MRNILQRASGHCHRIGAVGDNNMVTGIGGNGIMNNPPVVIGHLKAVLAHQRNQIALNRHIGFMQHFGNLRLADLELAFGVKIDLVDSATCGEYLDVHPLPKSFA